MNSNSGNQNSIINGELPLITLNRAGISKPGVRPDVTRTSDYPYANIHYVQHGTMDVTLDGQKATAHKGDIFIIPNSVSHRYRITSKSCSLIWIEFHGGGGELLAKRLINLASSPVISLNQIGSTEVEKQLKCLINKQKNIFENSINIYTIMMTIRQHMNVFMNNEQHQWQNQLSTACKKIEAGLHKELKVNKIANECGFSQSQLNRLFKKAYGMTPSAYIYHQRLEKAKKLLADENITLEIIAHQCGFYDVPHLVHRFKKSQGRTPQDYRDELSLF